MMYIILLLHLHTHTYLWQPRVFPGIITYIQNELYIDASKPVDLLVNAYMCTYTYVCTCININTYWLINSNLICGIYWNMYIATLCISYKAQCAVCVCRESSVFHCVATSYPKADAIKTCSFN